MAEESYQEHDLGNVYNAENVHSAADGHTGEVDNAHTLENIQEMDNAHENLLPEEVKLEPEEVQVAFLQEHPVKLEQEEAQVESLQEHVIKSEPEEMQVAENGSGGGEEKRWPGWPGENVFRMLVPSQKVGGIIGRKGEYIKKTCEETKARIKVLDGPHGTKERAVSSCYILLFEAFMITCYVECDCLRIMLCTYDNVKIAFNISTDGDESTPKGVVYQSMKAR